ncbi:glycosyltransferase family 4 protein [Cobetia sp. UCD-24C]|uniref:glycosyltransferase family 4 protein n=1 Tax=Cobetia sp. UCD-24C TaxID=1716176 RepID=UPI0009EA29C5|nr:glycosyltransferase family 4 protein [Cobetia sp. UCD-24C]
MEPKKILLRSSGVLGWKTHNNKIKRDLMHQNVNITETPYEPKLHHKLLIKPYGRSFSNFRIPLVSPAKMSNFLSKGSKDSVEYDVIYAASHIGLGGYEHMKARKIVTCDACIPSVIDSFGAKYFNENDISYEKHLLSLADKIFCMSHWTYKGLEKHYPEVINSCEILPSYIPDPVIGNISEKKNAKIELGYKEQDFIVAYISNSYKRKGGGIVKDLISKHNAVEWMVFGSSSKNFGNNHNLLKMPYIENSVLLNKYLKAADCLVLPSFVDMAPHVLGEAVSAGCALVTTNVGGLPEVCINNYNGYTVNDLQSMSEKIKFLSEDRSLLENFQNMSLLMATEANLKQEEVITREILS